VIPLDRPAEYARDALGHARGLMSATKKPCDGAGRDRRLALSGHVDRLQAKGIHVVEDAIDVVTIRSHCNGSLRPRSLIVKSFFLRVVA
jgi:hypothetical protein